MLQKERCWRPGRMVLPELTSDLVATRLVAAVAAEVVVPSRFFMVDH